MKPIKMTLNAFGPFSGSETIDFTALSDNGIFLVTGPTGSGKTTIFDGVCFALYGKASGDSRQNENFKSDFAPENELCSVSLTFDLRGKRFRVFRQPVQQKLTSKGGYTTVPGKAELMLPDGSVVTGVSEVNARIGEILGLSLGQFKQIVMLAQGEFQRLLESSNEEKQEIFRRIFSTHLFDRFAQGLAERTRVLNDTISKQLDAIAVCAAGMDIGTDAELSALVSAEPLEVDALLLAAERLLKTDRVELDDLEVHWNKLSLKREKLNLEQALDVNRKFSLLEDLRKKYAVLLGRKDYIAEQKSHLDYIRGAQQVGKSDEVIKQLGAQIADYRREIQECQARLPLLTQTMRQSQSAMYEAKSREEMKQALIERRAGLDRVRGVFTAISACEQELETLRAGMDRLRRNETALLQLKERAALLAQERALSKRSQGIGQLLALCERAATLSVEFASVKEDYIVKYDRFLSAQAGILARTLDDSLPCPVCGSLVHPHPAALSKDVPTQGELDATRARLDQLSGELNAVEADLKTGYRQLNYLDDVFQFPEEEITRRLAEIRAVKAETEAEVLALRSQIETATQEAERTAGVDCVSAKFDDEVAVLEEIAKITNRILKAEADVETRQRQADDLRESLESSFRDETEVTAEEEVLAGRIAEIDRQITACTEEFIGAKSEYDKLCKTVELSRSKMFGLNNQLNIAQNQFGVDLRIHRFSSREMYEEYRNLAPKAEEIEEIIGGYSTACTAASTELNALEAELEGKCVTDTEALSQSHRELTTLLSGLDQQKVSLTARIQINTQACAAIHQRFDGMAALYQEYRDVSELSRLAGGNNAQRLSFESYVLASYFDDVITLANVRLGKMTGQRYELRRRTEREKFGRASGLGLEIIDNYSGKARHITTLSGGESFKTSLALALSLADVVQMYAGGVVIDTMFIDEGFGTLDDESLSSAVQTLTSLREDGRVVGIISHVSELKERIPARLCVVPGRAGSHCEVSL